MGNTRRTVRASEIGSFIFCQRAWWYQRSNQPTLNKQELAAGSGFHHRHAGRMRTARALRLVSWLFLLLALTILVLAVRTAVLN